MSKIVSGVAWSVRVDEFHIICCVQFRANLLYSRQDSDSFNANDSEIVCGFRMRTAMLNNS